MDKKIETIVPEFTRLELHIISEKARDMATIPGLNPFWAHAYWALALAAADHADEPVGEILVGIEQGKVGWEVVENHQDRGLAVRLALEEQELVASTPEALEVAEPKIDVIGGMGAHLA